MKSRKRADAIRQTRGATFAWLLVFCSIIFPPFAEAETDLPAPASSTLDALIQEALAQSPMITSARKHWQALTEIPVQVSTLPDPSPDTARQKSESHIRMRGALQRLLPRAPEIFDRLSDVIAVAVVMCQLAQVIVQLPGED
jgi:hypothetical protein